MASPLKQKIKIDPRTDGIYVILDNSDAEAKPSRKDLLEVIEEYKIKQVNFEAINDIFKSELDVVEMKISAETSVAVKNEIVTIEVSKDKMEATIVFDAPEFGGGYLTVDEIITEMTKFGIKFGIDEQSITDLVQSKDSKDYNKRYLAAAGIPPAHGDDGQLLYNYDITGGGAHPKILADGTVDYKQTDYFVSIKAGDVIAYRTDPLDGESGTDVFGHPISQKPGKPAPKFSKGKNVYITEDEMELKAQTSGQLVVAGKTISVSPILEIKGDVGYETGNINFEGSVNVAGAVISGFTIEAMGNIEVKGIVEAASLIAGGSINLYGGMQGRFKGRIESGGNLFTKFAQNARLIVSGDLVTNALLHCNVDCKGSVLLEGDNCFIAGGTVAASGEVRAKTIGSYMGTRTEIKVGGNPEISGRYDQVKEEYDHLKAKYKKLNEDYEKIVRAGDVTQLDVKRKGMLLQLINHRNQIKEQALKTEAELSELIATLRKTKGRVIAEKVIYHGVTVTISNATLNLHDDITACVLRNVNDTVKVEPNTGIN